jgi:hypothetical protein
MRFQRRAVNREQEAMNAKGRGITKRWKRL